MSGPPSSDLRDPPPIEGPRRMQSTRNVRRPEAIKRQQSEQFVAATAPLESPRSRQLSLSHTRVTSPRKKSKRSPFGKESGDRNHNRKLPATPGDSSSELTPSPRLRAKKKKKKSRRSKKSSRRQKDQFPVKVLFSSGKQIICRCKISHTVDEFITECKSKLKVEDIGHLVLCTPDGELLDPPAVLMETGYVNRALNDLVTIPILCLCTAVEERKTPLQRQDSAADKDEIERLMNSFHCAFLLPGGQTLTLQITQHSPVRDVQQILLTVAKANHVILLNWTAYQLQVYRSDFVLDDLNQEIGSVPYILQCRQQATIPKLVLIQLHHDPYTPKEKEIELEVNSLIGRITTQNDDAEKRNFRDIMARVRYLEKKQKKQTQNDLNIYLADTAHPLQLPSNEKVIISVSIPEHNVVKKIAVKENETVDECMGQLLRKYFKNTEPAPQAQDFVLKVAGTREFLYGKHAMFDFEYIRKRIAIQEPINLTLAKRDTFLSVPSEEEQPLDAEWMQGGEEILEACTIQYRHEDVCNSDMTWDQKTHISIWELSEPFRVQIVGVENISSYCQNFSRIYDGEYFFYMSVGMYHGGELLTDAVKLTEMIPSQINPRWNSWIQFPIRMSNIPRATRLCFTLFATNRQWMEDLKKIGVKNATVRERREDRNRRQRKEMQNDIPIAWVNCQLILYDHCLRKGQVSLRMWRDERANPIGTCVQNSDILAPLLHLKLDEYQLPVIFPTKAPKTSVNARGTLLQEQPNPLDQERLTRIGRKDPLFVLSPELKTLFWKHRNYCSTQPASLPKLLLSVPWNVRSCVETMHELLQHWDTIPALDALELLDSRFSDAKVREFAVRCLESFRDSELQTYLLQLVQVLKYEPYHDSALARFLVRRAIRSERVGHTFFWYLKAEMHVPEISERYGLLLEAYLYGCSDYLEELKKQNDLMNSLQIVANHIKTVPPQGRREILVERLAKLELPEYFQLPIDPTWEASALLSENCKYMESKKLPLWLVMENRDPLGQPIVVIFKSGDDLRQDMLTLQILRIMDQLWKEEGLNLQLTPYGCISTGDEVGMIEVVLNSSTCAAITRDAGGATAVFKKSPIADWLASHNPGTKYDEAVERFMYSCAGYCVATYVLGIGDRHNDNIMIQTNGRLFHIDFGHFLGNFKKKFGFSRERAKFVFTPDFAHVLGGMGSPKFDEFVALCGRAYNILRKNATRFINLMAMMLSTGIPELTKASDIDYLRNTLCLDLEDDQAAQSFGEQISSSLGCKTTIINNMIHILAH